MTQRFVVTGQRIDPVKFQRARELRAAMTPAETRLWARLRGKALAGARFRRQQIIDGFIADFYCEACGVVVEVDGNVHAEQADYDAARDEHFRGRGLAVVRVSNETVMNRMAEALECIMKACEAASHRPHPPPPPLKREGETEDGPPAK